MDLNDVFSFVEVVKAGSFSQASRTLRLPKSTLSRKVTQLETRLGVQLLSRTTRKMQLTKIGEDYFQKMSLLLKEFSQAEQNATHEQLHPKGLIRFTAPLEVGNLLLAPMLQSFLNKYPEVELEMNFTDRFVNMVEEGYDLALRAGNLSDSSLKAKKVGMESFILCASPAYLQKYPAPKTVQALSEHRCLAFIPQSKNNTWNLNRGKEKAKVPLKNKILMNSLEMCKSLANEGGGIALLPHFSCREALLTGELSPVLPEWATEKRGFYLVYPEQKYMPLRLRLLIDHMSQVFEKMNITA